MRLLQFNFSDHEIDNFLKKQAKFELCVRDTCKNTHYKCFITLLNRLKIILFKAYKKCTQHAQESVVFQIGTLTFTVVLFRTSANKLSLNLDYLPYLRKFLTQPLVVKENNGIPEVIDLMDKYDIIKEDFDNILEVTKWPNSDDPMSQLSSKVSF